MSAVFGSKECPAANADDRFDGATWLAAPARATWRESQKSFGALFDSIQRHSQRMTTPVLFKVSPQSVQMMFRVDDGFRADARDAAAGLAVVRMPAARIASISFGGYATEAESRRQLKELARCARRDDGNDIGVDAPPPAEWYAAVYDGPFRVWGRKNKVFFFN